METNERPEHGSLRELESVVLVRRYREGEGRALEVLFERYTERVERIAYVRAGGLLRSREPIADLVQEVLLKMFRDIDRYEVREDARFIDWAATICERTLRNRVRFLTAEKRDAHRERPLRPPSASMDSSVAWDAVAGDLAPPEQLGERERQQLVDDCIRELRDDHREVILLKDFAGADWDYIAMTLGKDSKGAAQQLHRRARLELGERLRLKGV